MSDNVISNSSNSSDNVIVEKYIVNDSNVLEVDTDIEITTEYLSDTDSDIFINDTTITNNVESEDNTNEDLKTIKKESIRSDSRITSNDCFDTYVPITIPNDIDTFEVDLCYTETATTYYTQIKENKKCKVR